MGNIAREAVAILLKLAHDGSKFDERDDVRADYLRTRLAASILRYAPQDSYYCLELDHALRVNLESAWNGEALRVRKLAAIAQALAHDIRDGELTELVPRVRREVFHDMLLLAHVLIDESGAKDAATLLAGCVLEEHLRHACIRRQIPVRDGEKNKTAGALLADLYREKIVTSMQNKQVGAWLDMRNAAAHGRIDTYSKANADLMVRGISQFIRDLPA